MHGQCCFAGTYATHEAEDRPMPPTLPITRRSYMTVLLLLLRTLSSIVVASPPVRVMTVMEKMLEKLLYVTASNTNSCQAEGVKVTKNEADNSPPFSVKRPYSHLPHMP